MRRFTLLVLALVLPLLIVWIVVEQKAEAKADTQSAFLASSVGYVRQQPNNQATANITHISSITYTPAFTVYLPFVSKPFVSGPQSGIYGRVTYQGDPIAGINLTLQLMHDESQWNSSTVLTVTTQADGSYLFTDVPDLEYGKKYCVRYMNYRDGNADNPNFLGHWYSYYVYSYTVGASVPGGDFDIADVVPTSPANGAFIALPYTFEWTPRAATPSDNYRFKLHSGLTGYFYETDPLGYTGSYSVNSLPPGFETYKDHFWFVLVSGPDGSIGGVNYMLHVVRFTTEGNW